MADDHDDPNEGRTTAPQSPYSGRDVAIGALVLAIGLALAVVVPLVAI